MQFEAWPKTARFFRDVVISEKIDGTNAAVVIEKTEDGRYAEYGGVPYKALPDGIIVGAQSRKRLITPDDDNHGFARWVWDNAEGLVDALGIGRHFGEWWGSGINRGYGLPKGEKRFSLFNTKRYSGLPLPLSPEHAALVAAFSKVPALRVVPVLHEGQMDQWVIEDCMNELFEQGSKAAPGFNNPEGVCIFHTQSRQVYKYTFDGDGHKGNQ